MKESQRWTVSLRGDHNVLYRYRASAVTFLSWLVTIIRRRLRIIVAIYQVETESVKLGVTIWQQLASFLPQARSKWVSSWENWLFAYAKTKSHISFTYHTIFNTNIWGFFCVFGNLEIYCPSTNFSLRSFQARFINGKSSHEWSTEASVCPVTVPCTQKDAWLQVLISNIYATSLKITTHFGAFDHDSCNFLLLLHL